MDQHEIHETLTRLCAGPGRGRLVAKVCRRFGFDHVELIQDALQEAYIKALEKWAFHGVPDDPEAWLLRVSGNVVIDRLRRDQRWSDIKFTMAGTATKHSEMMLSPGILAGIDDDQLAMIYACCHPALTPTSQVAISLKAVFGLTTEEIAKTFLTSATTLGQRISRAKNVLRDDTEALESPDLSSFESRTPVVLDVLYLVFTNGYFSLTSDVSLRQDLCYSAIDLVRRLCGHSTFSNPASFALLALMLFHGARLASRQRDDRIVFELADQYRTEWNQQMINDGILALRSAATGNSLTKYHLEAEIASIHATVAAAEATDWMRILECYDLLCERENNPVITLNRLVAVWKVHGSTAALRHLERLARDAHLANYFPMYVLRSELHAATGQYDSALIDIDAAESLTDSRAIRNHLADKRRAVLKQRNARRLQ